MQTKSIPQDQRATRVDDLVHAIVRESKHVVTFLGFGELGYEVAGTVEAIASAVLAELDPHTTLVATATLVTRGFLPGIAEVYDVARDRGFVSLGVHPSLALTSRDRYSVAASADRVFLVQDDSWGGWLEGTESPSPTLEALARVTTEVVAIGGGAHAAQEIQEFRRRQTPIRFRAADMNHELSRRWASANGLRIPAFRGAAHDVWFAIGGS